MSAATHKERKPVPTKIEIGEGWRSGCPDCGSMPDRGVIRHDGACPIASGVERATESDRLWFEAHPAHREFTRRMTWAERVEIETTLGKAVHGDYVRVHQPKPGGPRSRFFPTNRDGTTDVMVLDGLSGAPGGERK